MSNMYENEQDRSQDRQSEQQGTPRHGMMADGFGFVTDEDRAKWEQQRQQKESEKKSGSINRSGASATAEGMSDMMRQGLQAKLFAATLSDQEPSQLPEVETVEEKRQRMIDEHIRPEPREDSTQFEAGDDEYGGFSR